MSGDMENCPFCGSKMQVAMKNAILCLECYASGPQAEDRKAAWNTRAETAAWNAAIRAAAKMADEGMDSHRAIAADIRTLLKPEVKS